MKWYLAVLKKYADFSGRASPLEYWTFVLVNFIITLLIAVFDAILHLTNVLGLLYCLALLIPTFAVGVRRLHDTNKSGWALLILPIPIIGTAILLVFLLRDGTPGDNRFGPSPKAAAAVEATPA
jgi:uncharacterized membrane protein YhaH (DUF805 family)